MDFYGDVRYFEFLLKYSSPDSEFSDFSRLMETVRENAGFRIVFKGIVHIKLDEWCGHQDEKHFISVLDYLQENTSDWLIVMSVSPEGKNRKEQIDAMVSTCSMFLRLEKLILKMPVTKQYITQIEQFMDGYGLAMDDEAKKMIAESVNVLRRNRYFDDAGTIDMLSRDIVYCFYSQKEHMPSVITREHLKQFAPDGDYIQRTIKKTREVRKIGFALGESDL